MAAIALPTDDVCGATQAGYYRYIVGPARVKGTKIGGNCRAQETSFEPPPAWPGWNCRQQPARTTPRTPRLNRGPVLPARIMHHSDISVVHCLPDELPACFALVHPFGL